MKERIISAIVAIIIATVILIFHSTIVYKIAIALIIGGMLFELFKAEKCLKYKSTVVICMLFGFIMPFAEYIQQTIGIYIVMTALIFAMFITFLKQYAFLKFDKLCFMITCTVLGTLSMSSLIKLEEINKTYGIFCVVITLCGAWLADTGAYFAGTFFGKHKLCPNISPKKTVEGLIGGVICNGIFMFIISLIYQNVIMKGSVSINLPIMGVLGMICALLGLLGDLTASLIKRQCKLKDYGNIMPGHGGIMDRFDSVLFVSPFMLVAFENLNLITLVN